MRDVEGLSGEGLHYVRFADEEGLDYGAEGQELEGCWGGGGGHCWARRILDECVFGDGIGMVVEPVIWGWGW